jgi:signal transduction histidine kinase
LDATLDMRGLLHAILTCVTAGPGLGFNRAALFLVNDGGLEAGAHTHLVAAMAIGPATPEEAQATWAKVRGTSLDELLSKAPGDDAQGGFQKLIEGLQISIAPAGVRGPDNPLLDAFWNRRVVRILDPEVLADVSPRLRQAFGESEVLCVPLVAGERALGLIVADNAFSGEPIGEQHVQLFQLLALLAGTALDNARVYRRLEHQAQQLKKTIRELNATQEQLIHSERLATVGAVVARVSHEIRNPLTTIGGFARTLIHHPDDVHRVTRNAGIIVEEVEKLEALLKEMLDFTSPRLPTLDPTDLNAIIDAFVYVHQGELAGRHITLDIELAPALPPVPLDRSQLQRVLMNLWQNATQAMEELGPDDAKVLGVKTWRTAGEVHIAVSDTGRGIARHVLPHVFTPFFTTKQRGTGLGLAVAKKIVDDHRGSIQVQTQTSPGTTFVISLPLAR